jgi:hypothetical protein
MDQLQSVRKSNTETGRRTFAVVEILAMACARVDSVDVPPLPAIAMQCLSWPRTDATQNTIDPHLNQMYSIRPRSFFRFIKI